MTPPHDFPDLLSLPDGAMERIAISAAPDGILLVSADGTILMANPAMEAISGYSADDLVGRSVGIFLPPWLRDKHDGLVRSFFHRPSARPMGMVSHLQLMRSDGRPVSIDIALGSCEARGEPAAVVFIRDMTEMRRLQEDIQHQATHDMLTGLSNRWMFGQHLNQAMARAQRHGQPLALLLLDLDDFKAINDGHGHAIGDQVLVEVARRLKTCLRGGDTLARLGGDEFTVLLPEVAGRDGARQVADKLLRTLALPCRLHGFELHVAASIGIALFPDDAPDADTLMRYADMAMYSAKDAGRNTYAAYASRMGHALEEKLRLHERLKHALAQGGLTLHYQPQVDVVSGRLTGVEALARWNDPELGEVSPERFIAVAVGTGLIHDLGEWVMRTACNQLAHWHASGMPLRVSVNLSAQQFRRRDLVERLQQLMADTGVPVHALELEITESEAMCDPQQARELLERLRHLGVAVALDDFGTGYSSLSYLRDLPVARLKIDREFIRHIAQRAADATLVRAVIGLAHTLGLPVVAEGVETEEQLAFLRQHGCEACQGWLFSRAVPPEAIEAMWLAQDGVTGRP